MSCNATTKAGKACRNKTPSGVCHVHNSASSVGVVYVLSNECMPGLLKIGWTRGTAAARATTLSATSVAMPFVVEHHTGQMENAHSIEKGAHDALSSQRVSQNREFFRCTVDQAKSAIAETMAENVAAANTPGATAEHAPTVHVVHVPTGTSELRILFGMASI